MTRPLICLALLAGATLFRPAPALAAESYDNCAGFITSLPVTITTQGVWCMDRDLATAISSGVAITVATNNVTIDCNRFKLGGLAAGPGTTAVGIAASSRLNVTVRNCNIRGFFYGVSIGLGGGHVVEHSRFDGNRLLAINLTGAGSVIRSNQLLDTGGASGGFATGIYAANGVDVTDNMVNGVAPSANDAMAIGIWAPDNAEGSVVGNRVRGLAPTGTGSAYGIETNGSSGGMVIRDNILLGPGSGFGIRCPNNGFTARGNVVAKFSTPISGCFLDSNTVNPN